MYFCGTPEVEERQETRATWRTGKSRVLKQCAAVSEQGRKLSLSTLLGRGAKMRKPQREEEQLGLEGGEE